MAFLIEGDVEVAVNDGIIAESTLNKKANSFDVCLQVINADGAQSDWWRGNISGDYSQLKNKSGKTNTQVTFENVVELGYNGPDFSGFPNDANIDWDGVQNALKAMKGIRTFAHCKRSNCGQYINVKWLGSGSSGPAPVNMAQLAQSIQTPATNAQPAQGGGGFGNVQQNNAQPAGNGGFGQ